MTKKAKTKPTSDELQSKLMKRWHSHVKSTPPGMIPVLLDGRVPAWNVASGPLEKISAYFGDVAPKRSWPQWLITAENARLTELAAAREQAAKKSPAQLKREIDKVVRSHRR